MVVANSVAAFILCILVIVPIRHIAVVVGLVDVPDRRKIHIGNVPLIGGLAIFVAAALVLGSATPPDSGLMIGLASFALVLIGMTDDLYPLRVLHRLFAHIFILICFVLASGTMIYSLGNIFGTGPLSFTLPVAAAFTVFCLLGVINAMNMIDGLDGLLGVVAGSSFLVIGGLAYMAGFTFEAQTSLVLAATLLGFLLYNLGFFGQGNKIFCGDSGSMMIGFVLATLCIRLTQHENAAFDPVVAGWIFGLPLVDTVVVIVRRMVNGTSPFSARRDHIHHLMLNAGFKGPQVLLILAIAHLSLIAAGLACHATADYDALFFWLFVVITFAHFYLTPRILERCMLNNRKPPLELKSRDLDIPGEDIAQFDVSTESAERTIERLLELSRSENARARYFSCLNPHSAVLAASSTEFEQALKSSDILIPDGIGIVLTSRLFGGKITRRVTGSDIFLGLSQRMNSLGGRSCFFLGSTPETLEKLTARYAADFPAVNIAGAYSPPFAEKFSTEESDRIRAMINAAKPDVVWLGLGAPKQECFIARNIESLDTGLLAPVGAVFDFYTGNVARASTAWQELGLEWLPRLIQEPGRLWKRSAISAPLFLLLSLKHKLSQKLSSTPHRSRL